jgi:hypothetical protein
LLQTDEEGSIQSGSYAEVANAVAAGSRIGVVYPRAGRVISRTCSSVVDYTTDGTVHCFITDAFDTTDAVQFSDPVAFEYIIISTEGDRQTVKRDLAGNQLNFEGGDCDGQAVCTDRIGVTWVALD